ncbi:M48 family metallopeptidase [Loktanella sp. SALINAS62]|uniref:M48 family metallopeptidase n=1 Tax=Loktanella sp. SALINAS62 TaxID=2706124 RepID=UPI001B8C8EC5|nr:M48 family metallopeptidase [Loktanella sp. SALINAS62]MBS1301967.1 M48 family metallopeptidase [Loktanella sp. SALINAS62]
MMRPFLTSTMLAAMLGLSACDDAPTLVSDTQVAQMGLQEWEQITSSMPASTNAEYQRRLDRVTRRLLNAAGENPADWRWQVFQSGQPNAFALPGNRIGVFSGMMQIANTDAQLAAVVGHEIGHLQANHSAERVSAQIASELGLSVLDAALGAGEVVGREQIGSALGMGLNYGVLLPYSRRNELEADRLGIELMNQAGYDPNAALRFWESMARANANRGPAFLTTHPAPESRIAQIEEIIAAL